jgi:hypothetical protein
LRAGLIARLFSYENYADEKEIEKNYSKSNRHYHTLEHLENLLNELNGVREHISERTRSSRQHIFLINTKWLPNAICKWRSCSRSLPDKSN